MPRPRAKKAAALPPPPGPEEWCFEPVPESELVACTYWEYARESAWMRDLKRRCELPEVWRMKQTEAHKFVGEDVMRVQSEWDTSHVLAHGLFSGNPMPCGSDDPAPVKTGRHTAPRFPCPWQQLLGTERGQRSRIPDFRNAALALPFCRGGWDVAGWLVEYGKSAVGQVSLPDPARPGWRPGQSIMFAGAEMGIFEIGWDFYTNEEICEAFTRWVSRNRPEEMPAPDRRDGGCMT